ncbi:MAG TPA: nucleic acid-binding protein, partial [Mycobacterium sp.]|nr:nucleic acid-binding protein [Mycobacterium sp.]
DVTVGMAVEVYYQTFDGPDGDLVLHQFRPSG